MSIWPLAAQDGEELPHHDNGQDWIVAWHPPPVPPDGTPHGAAGICLTGNAEIVLVQNAGGWEIPAGRPEGDETWKETLRREMMEEACAAVIGARLLGFSRGKCLCGKQKGLVIVRSVWRAEVELRPWNPQFEMTERLVIPIFEVWNRLTIPESVNMARINARMLVEAGIPPCRAKDNLLPSSQGICRVTCPPSCIDAPRLQRALSATIESKRNDAAFPFLIVAHTLPNRSRGSHEAPRPFDPG